MRSCSTQKYRDATCNCAFAIRTRDDVILIDRCGTKKTEELSEDTPITVKMLLNGNLTRGTSVRSVDGGKKYYVWSKCSFYKWLKIYHVERLKGIF